MQRLTGIGVSPGVVVGRAVLLMQNPLVIRFPIGLERVPGELARLEEAREQSRRQLVEIKARVARGSAAELGYLFEAQLLMIDDPMLVARARALIAEQQVNAEWAVQRAFEDLSGIFDGIEDAYLRERRGDVADVVGRLRHEPGDRDGDGAPICSATWTRRSVLIADELTPSMAAQVDWRKVLGFATDTGSRTASHGDSGAVAARSGRRRTGEREPRGPAGRDRDHRRGVGRRHRSIRRRIWWSEAARRGHARRGLARAGRAGAGARRPSRADGVAISLQANIELPDDIGRRPGLRRSGHRPVPIGVPARHRRRRGR